MPDGLTHAAPSGILVMLAALSCLKTSRPHCSASVPNLHLPAFPCEALFRSVAMIVPNLKFICASSEFCIGSKIGMRDDSWLQARTC